MDGDIQKMEPKGVESENCVSSGIGNLRDRAIIITQFSPTGGLRIGEKFINPKLLDILVGIDKIFVIPEKWSKEGGEVEEEANNKEN